MNILVSADRLSGTGVISLKKILEDGSTSEQTLLRTVQLLLQGIEQHAIEGVPDDLLAFRGSIHQLTSSFDGTLSAEELLEQAGSALQSLEEYNRRTARYLKRPAGEWHAVVNMLASAVAGTAAASPENIRRLREIAGKVRSAHKLEEVHQIRLQFSECLTEIQLETRRQRQGEASPVEQTAGESESSPAANDLATGFAGRSQAEAALVQAWQTDPPSYVVVMALDRVQIFNMRFGHSVGDEVLHYFGGFIQDQLRATDQVFRWSGQALLALLPRPDRLEIVRKEVSRLLETRCEHTVQTASRTILLPIVPRWAVFPSMAAPRLLIHKIDEFAERKTPRDSQS